MTATPANAGPVETKNEIGSPDVDARVAGLLTATRLALHDARNRDVSGFDPLCSTAVTIWHWFLRSTGCSSGSGSRSATSVRSWFQDCSSPSTTPTCSTTTVNCGFPCCNSSTPPTENDLQILRVKGDAERS